MWLSNLPSRLSRAILEGLGLSKKLTDETARRIADILGATGLKKSDFKHLLTEPFQPRHLDKLRPGDVLEMKDGTTFREVVEFNDSSSLAVHTKRLFSPERLNNKFSLTTGGVLLRHEELIAQPIGTDLYHRKSGKKMELLRIVEATPRDLLSSAVLGEVQSPWNALERIADIRRIFKK